MFDFRAYFLSISCMRAYKADSTQGSNGASYILAIPASDASFQHIYTTTGNINYTEVSVGHCSCAIWSGGEIRISSPLSAIAQHNRNGGSYTYLVLGV